MTAQIDDEFQFQNQEFAIAGISEGELFDVSVLDLEPRATCTACWRGYQCVYSVQEGRLVLANLYVNLMQDSLDPNEYIRQVGPVINGVKPRAKGKGFDIFNNYYLGVNLPLEYTGGLLLADGFIQKLYVHMGFHPAWKYKKVYELIFENGLLIAEYDRSAKMAEIRALFENSDDELDDSLPTNRQIKDFVTRAFDRTYERDFF
jgi:hypothetical protein